MAETALRVKRDQYQTVFDKNIPPVLTVKSGSTVLHETEDAHCATVRIQRGSRSGLYATDCLVVLPTFVLRRSRLQSDRAGLSRLRAARSPKVDFAISLVSFSSGHEEWVVTGPPQPRNPSEETAENVVIGKASSRANRLRIQRSSRITPAPAQKRRAVGKPQRCRDVSDSGCSSSIVNH